MYNNKRFRDSEVSGGDMFNENHNNSLNNSGIETEGHIGSSPNKNQRQNLYATGSRDQQFEQNLNLRNQPQYPGQ